MTQKNKGQVPIQNPTPKKTSIRNHTTTDPLLGWFRLAKSSRNLQRTRGRKEGRQ